MFLEDFAINLKTPVDPACSMREQVSAVAVVVCRETPIPKGTVSIANAEEHLWGHRSALGRRLWTGQREDLANP